MSKKLVLHVALVSMVLASGAPITALDCTPGKIAQWSALGFMTFSTWALMHQHPTENFQQKGEWKGLLKAHKLFKKQPRAEYIQNALDVFWTRWIGQIYKSGYIELDKSNNAVKPTKKCLPHGVMGKTHGHLYELSKAKEMLIGLAVTAWAIQNPEAAREFFNAAVAKAITPDAVAKATSSKK